MRRTVSAVLPVILACCVWVVGRPLTVHSSTAPLASFPEPAQSPARSSAGGAAVQEAAPAASKNASPFGFEFGMSKEKVIQKLGKNAVAKDGEVNVVFSTAPNPHPDFDSYIVAFSPQRGLLKITALSRDIETSDDGSELRSKFNFFLSALRDKYGKADKDFDFCKGNDVECESEYFMMTLKEKNRYLNSFWSRAKAGLPSPLTTVAIDAAALGMNKGYIKISYEFEGWNEFVDELNKKRNSTF